MANFKERVRDTTATTGTGDITLLGSTPANCVAFNVAYAVGATRIPISIVGASDWEVCYARLSSSTTLVRELVLASSNANALVNFSAGTKEVFVTIPAAWEGDLLPRGRSEAMRLSFILP